MVYFDEGHITVVINLDSGGFMKNTQLTSAEIANLWSQYMNDTLSICMSKYALQVIEDSDIRAIFEQALQFPSIILKW